MGRDRPEACATGTVSVLRTGRDRPEACATGTVSVLRTGRDRPEARATGTVSVLRTGRDRPEACATGTVSVLRTGRDRPEACVPRSVWQFRCIGQSQLELRDAAETLFLEVLQAAGGPIDLPGEAGLIAMHVVKEEAVIRHMRQGHGGTDRLVELVEFLCERRGVAVHLEVDGGGLVLPSAAEAPVGGDHLVTEDPLERADGIPEGVVFRLQAEEVLVVLIA